VVGIAQISPLVAPKTNSSSTTFARALAQWTEDIEIRIIGVGPHLKLEAVDGRWLAREEEEQAGIGPKAGGPAKGVIELARTTEATIQLPRLLRREGLQQIYAGMPGRVDEEGCCFIQLHYAITAIKSNYRYLLGARSSGHIGDLVIVCLVLVKLKPTSYVKI
jgi:hypothetical protein